MHCYNVLAIDEFALSCLQNDGLEAEVYRAYAGCLNLLDGRSRLICFLGKDAFNVPGAVTVKLTSGDDFLSLGVREGELMHFRFNLEGARRWESSLASSFPGSGKPGSGPALGNRLEKMACKSPTCAAGNFLSLCTTLSNDGGTEAVRRDLADLIGLGPGLTPSGDDMLIGLLAALWTRGLAGGEDAVRAMGKIGLIRSLLAGFSERTTLISWNFLAHAAAGRFAEPVIKIIRALLGGDDGTLSALVCRLFFHGASSGRDTYFGIREGLFISLEEAA